MKGEGGEGDEGDEGNEEVDQGEVSTIILGMLESSGFPKSDSVIISVSLSLSLSLYLGSFFIFE